MAVGVPLRVVEVTTSSRNWSPGPRPLGISAQSAATSVCACAYCGAAANARAARTRQIRAGAARRILAEPVVPGMQPRRLLCAEVSARFMAAPPLRTEGGGGGGGGLTTSTPGALHEAGFAVQHVAALCATDPPLALTHLPLRRIPPTAVNVHGHLHRAEGPTRRHINLSVEQIDYAPVGPGLGARRRPAPPSVLAAIGGPRARPGRARARRSGPFGVAVVGSCGVAARIASRVAHDGGRGSLHGSASSAPCSSACAACPA